MIIRHILLLAVVCLATQPGMAARTTVSSWALPPASAPAAPSAKAAGEKVAAAFLEARSCPFSFTYGGKSSRALLPNWPMWAGAVVATPQSIKQTTRWTDPVTGLELSAEVTSFRDFPAVEWVLRFRNTGSQDTPIIEEVQALDLALDTTPKDLALQLHQIAGSTATANDYVPSEKSILSGASERFAPLYGHSSYTTFPFFTLSFGRHNLITAIGWTGQWAAAIDRDQSGSTRLRAGMELTHLKLLPGESIRTPRILLLTHQGDRMDTQNLFRRLILTHYSPRVDGQIPRAAIGAQGFNHLYLRQIPEKWATEAGQLQSARINQLVGADTLWMDAGWFPGFFPHGVGNWQPRSNDFPRGLKPVGDECHRLGLRFLLWYEPERVASDTAIANEHPEFVLGGKNGGIFNLGDEKARHWMTDLIDRQIEEFGLDCYRQDFNFVDALGVWRAQDAPDRRGISEIRHIEGLYAMWDDLRARHPHLYIDNCAGGGTRIDLETISRAIVQTRSDTEGAPGRADWEQSQTWGLSFYYPLSSSFTWDLTTYDFRSYAGNGLVGEWDVLSSEFPVNKVRAAFTEAREDQPYFMGDYYPLTPWTVAGDRWMAYQFHRGDLESGIVLAFRHAESAEATLAVKLRGLEAQRSYQVAFIGEDYATETKVQTGEQLAGLELHLDKPRTSLLIRYRAQPGTR